jgi:hypothetical protein
MPLAASKVARVLKNAEIIKYARIAFSGRPQYFFLLIATTIGSIIKAGTITRI